LSWALKEKRTGQEKVTKGYISPIWGEAPTEAIYIKNCVVDDLLDEIMCAKFLNEVSSSYHFTGGQIFLLIFEWALQQCSATALPVISDRNTKLDVAELCESIVCK